MSEFLLGLVQSGTEHVATESEHTLESSDDGVSIGTDLVMLRLIVSQDAEGPQV
jgi:hypothetical protein